MGKIKNALSYLLLDWKKFLIIEICAFIIGIFILGPFIFLNLLIILVIFGFLVLIDHF